MTMKIFVLSIAIATTLLTGCMFNSPLAFRSVLYFEQQEATTEGKIGNRPTAGDAKVEAPKTTTDSFKPSTATSVMNEGGDTLAKPAEQKTTKGGDTLAKPAE